MKLMFVEKIVITGFLIMGVSVIPVALYILYMELHDSLKCKEEFGYYRCEEQRLKRIEVKGMK